MSLFRHIWMQLNIYGNATGHKLDAREGANIKFSPCSQMRDERWEPPPLALSRQKGEETQETKFHPLLFRPGKRPSLSVWSALNKVGTRIYYLNVFKKNIHFFILKLRVGADAAKISTCNLLLFLEVLIGFATSENWSDLEKIKSHAARRKI